MDITEEQEHVKEKGEGLMAVDATAGKHLLA